jgi:PKD repeat protein
MKQHFARFNGWLREFQNGLRNCCVIKKFWIMKKLLLLFSLLACTLSLRAQQPAHDGCATDYLWQLQQLQDPRMAARQAAIDRQLADMAARGSLARASGITSVLTVPVVVHVIHNGGLENISNAVVLQGIQDLNDAFANVGAYNPLTGVNTDIQFCLASQDPSGAGTSGIVRVQSPLTNMVMETQDISLKNLSRWDPTKYLNIWLVAEITSNSMGSGVAGYAYFPSSHGQPNDGIVNEARWFGSTTDNSKVHVHEAGHYLGLYHTFQGGCTNGDCLSDGDRVCDTPPDNSTAAVLCSSTINTCNTDDDDLSANNPFRPIGNGGLGDQPDMYINYMDYGYQSCQSAFTQGQKDRMTAALTTSRASLLTSLGCLSPCQNTIVASFTPSATTVATGTLVTFSNASTGATTYEWQRNGMAFSTNANATWVPNAAGTYTITLIASNGDPSCTRSTSAVITVTCTEHASFTASASSIPVGGTVNFTNTSTGGSTNFQWLIDGVPMATSTQFSHTFSAAGGYNVYLVQTGATCSDTSLFHYITVGNCKPKFANHWYFGRRAGIDFNSGAPVAVYNANPAFFASEPMAAASDTNGNLQFYTDGLTIYNKMHQVMVNGTNMGAPYSGSQCALAIPKPGSATNYYLFTQAHFGGSQNDGDGLYVSEIDMTLDNGNGAVIMHTDTLQRIACEKLTAVNHCNGRDVWVINHEYGTDAFNAFLVTPAGVQPAVVSNVGFVINGGFNNTTAIGMIKVSPNGKKIASTITYHYPRLELFDFDNATGVVSNGQTIINANIQSPYSVEWSPDGKHLYYENSGDRQVLFGNIWQFDMTLPTIAAIEASMTKVSGDYAVIGGMQLAPDGKIYIGQYETAINDYYLARINNPNAVGLACNFAYNDFYIGQGNNFSSNINLPNFNVSYFSTTTPEIAGPDTVCAHSQGIVFERPRNSCSGGGTVSFQVAGDAQVISYTDTTATLSFGGPGNVILTILESAPCGSGSGDWNIVVVPSDTTVYIGPDVSLCLGGSTTLDAGAGYTSYQWSTGANTQTIMANAAGTYWCEVSGASQCRPRDSVVVSQSATTLSVNLGPDQTVCAGQIATLDAGPGYGSYQWQDGSTNQSFTAWFPGNYSVTVTGSSCAGTASDQAQVLNSQAFNVNLGADTVICAGNVLILNPGNFAGNYLWQDGSNAATFSVTQAGSYWVQVSNAAGCASGDTIEVSNCVAVNDPLAGMEVRIWPNPTNGLLHFSMELVGRPRHVELSLWDLAGRNLLQVEPIWNGGRVEQVLDLRNLATGIYFLRMQTEHRLQTWKVEKRQ